MSDDDCDRTKANSYVYFKNPDDLIIELTAYGMAKGEDGFMKRVPMRFIEKASH